jgi:Mn-dependent DtxR family transcriptional regulator
MKTSEIDQIVKNAIEKGFARHEQICKAALVKGYTLDACLRRLKRRGQIRFTTASGWVCTDKNE